MTYWNNVILWCWSMHKCMPAICFEDLVNIPCFTQYRYKYFGSTWKPREQKQATSQETAGRQDLSKCFVSPDRWETSKTRCLLSILNDVTWEDVGKQIQISVYRIPEVHFEATGECKGFLSKDSQKKTQWVLRVDSSSACLMIDSRIVSQIFAFPRINMS